MQKLISLLPMENIVLETDSPALSFTPGESNEPANLIKSVKIVAEIKVQEGQTKNISLSI